jgi:stress response protein YsnF
MRRRHRSRETAPVEQGTSIPVIQEEVTVHKRPVERRVRIVRRLVHEPRDIEIPLTTERVEVERVEVDRLVEAHPEPRWDGEVLIIPRVEEVLVVEKRLRVCEELHVRTVKTQDIHRETVDVGREELEIERESTSKPTEEERHEDDHSNVHG